MRRFLITIIPLMLLLTGAACDKKGTQTVEPAISTPAGALTKLSDAELTGRQATIETSQGPVVVELFGTEAPIAVSNFITLTNKKFYDGLRFHRYVANFVIQGGDPKGTGFGGPDYKFIDEPVKRDYTRGVVAMANSGPDTNGSQFFIVLQDQPNLPKSYTIFGQVVSGMENVDKLRVGDMMTSITIAAVVGT